MFEGQYRAAPEGRRIEVPRLTIPRSTEAILAPVDLVVTIDGAEYVLAVLQEFPGSLALRRRRNNGPGAETPGPPFRVGRT
ncbi:hypothetical protein ACH4TQ_04730 [Streptomyces sp. NPDC021218]|uniref:hypothetical protein n=1 Tax=Streptomyces sp. NPDC021218 TaxID=3365119 RepID=UPI00379B53C5